MPVTEVLRGVGSWSVKLSSSTPLEIMQHLSYFGHICIVPGQLGELDMTDALLKPARYVGVFRGKSVEGGLTTLEGAGMAHWMGDEDDKGDVIESLMTFTAATFQSAIGQVLTGAASVEEGTVYNVSSAPFTATLQYLTRRRALDYICDTLGGDWRINGDATVDAGLESDLFQVVPQAILSPKTGYQSDMFLESVGGEASTDQSMEDFTTRTLLLASGSEAATVTATADINPALNLWKDLLGNPVKITRMISESETDASNAQARAQLQLNRFSGTTDSLRCSTEKYDLKGTVEVGDYINAFAPDEGVYDLNNEVQFNGDRIYPMRLRLIQMSWPIVAGMSVAFRDANGNWYDLTPYVNFETGPSHLQVGGYSRTLVAGRDGGPMGSRPIADTSVPGVPAWVTPFIQSVYQSPIRGETRAQAVLKWTRPANVDGTAILDGSHFEIRYRTASTPIFPSSHAQMSLFTHGQLAAGTHAQPITYTAGGWQYQVAPWSELEVLLQDLVSNMPYEAQIRAVDSAKPANAGAWSALTSWQTNGDTIPPAVPAAPSVASSRIAVQITHYLGRSDGGTFNLDADLHHLEVHGQYEPLFSPTDSTLLGKLPANNSAIQGRVPVVGTFQVESVNPVYFKVVAVDNDGNKSSPSIAAVATALLIDDAHISNLTVSKVTAGTINATWVMGGKIMSGVEGAGRVQMVPTAFEAYDNTNTQTVSIDITGNVVIRGELRSNFGTGERVVLAPKVGSSYMSEIRFYPGNLTWDGYAYIGSSSNILGSMGNGVFASGANFTGSNTGPQGGRLALASEGALLGYQNSTYDSFIWINNQGKIQMKGYFGAAGQGGGRDALVAGISIAPGGTNAAYGFAYGASMIGVMSPTYSVSMLNNQRCWHGIISSTATGFSVSISLANDWNGSQWTWTGFDNNANTVNIFWAAYRVSA
jgi:hypothetical protein